MEQKPLFSDDQLIQASEAAKKFGIMQERAQNFPLFVTGKQGKIKTVLLGYGLFKKIYARLAELEEAENDRILRQRLDEVEKDAIGNSVPWDAIRRTNG
jgi:hypothetical protein